MGINVGIDLGTSNSVISYVKENGEVEVIPNPEGKLTTPSIVFYDGNEIIVGDKVKGKYKMGSDQTVGSFKVNMGSKHTYEVGGKTFTPVELSAEVLKYLKAYAEEYTGQTIDKAVITVPADFKELQRRQTREAGEMAGLNVARIINEPTASALAYGINLEEEKTILVYDLGGGTFDVSLLTIDSENRAVDVIATKGDNKLGGDDFDKEIMKTILRTLLARDKYTPINAVKVERVLAEISRQAKEALSENERVTLDLSIIKKVDPEFKYKNGNLDLTVEIFKTAIKPFIDRTIQILVETVEVANMSLEDIDEIILVGGSTKTPFIKHMIEEATGLKVRQKDINPDLIVSIGATIQSKILSGKEDLVLLDVTPLDLSIELANGMASRVIQANSSIPTKKSKVYTTNRDNQTTLEFNIWQGNNPIAKENSFLGKLVLDDIPPMPKGEPQVDLTIKINENGELEIKATEVTTFKSVTVKRELGI